MKKILLLSLGTLLLSACAATPATSGTAAAGTDAKNCLPTNMPGSYAKQVAITPEARAALDTVLAQMNTSAKLQEIIEVRTQVVAGTNYAITFKLDNGEVWHTVVWRTLQGEYKITQPASKQPFLPLCE